MKDVAGGAASAASLHRQVWAMAGPIILANVSVPLLGAVDTAVVGHLPEPYYIGAVAIGAMLFNYIYHLFNCLRMGTTAPTAQARGAGNHGEVRAVLGRALLLGTAIGAATSSTAVLFSGTPGADGEKSHLYDLQILNGGLTTLRDKSTQPRLE